MNPGRVQRYVVTMMVLAVVCLVLADWGSLLSLPTSALLGLAGLIAIALFSESLAIGLSVGGGSSSITFLPLLASVQLFGPAAGVALIGYVLRNAHMEVHRINILLNKTREEMAKEYLTKTEANTDIDRVILRLDALDAKLDRMLER